MSVHREVEFVPLGVTAPPQEVCGPRGLPRYDNGGRLIEVVPSVKGLADLAFLGLYSKRKILI